jgi:two-component system sensor histidine kinase KdpD
MSLRVLASDGLATADRAAVSGLGRQVTRASRHLIPYLWGALTVLSSTELALVASRHLQLADIIMLHLIGVVVIATRFDMAVSVFTAIASVLAFDFVFVPPAFVFSLPDVKSAITCAGMLAVAVVISGLTTRARRFEARARSREAKTALLYELGRELVEAKDTSALLATAVGHFERLLGERVAVLVPTGPDSTLAAADALGPVWLSEAELERAHEIWQSGAIWPTLARLSRSSGTLVTHFFRLTGTTAPLALLAVRGTKELFADASEREFFDACAHQAALALERADLAEKAASAELAAKREHVHNALLRSISHDFRTPLAAIVGAGLSLAEYGTNLDGDARRLLERTVVEQGQRLNRLLTNVLSATRLDHGELRLSKTPCTLDEVVESALRHLGDSVNRRRIDVALPFDLPLVDVDPTLFEQLVVNVVENAVRYSPPETPIEIAAWVEGDSVQLSVSDRGPGLALGDQRRIFEKFYRGSAATASDGGMGLGLTICQAIAQAHGGTIAAENRAGGGLSVTTSLACVHERSYPSAPGVALHPQEPC